MAQDDAAAADGDFDDAIESSSSRRLSINGGRGKSTPCAMTAIEEHQLATYMSLLSRSGKALKQYDIRMIAQQIMESKDKIAFRKGNCPTAGWVQKFKLRHPELEYKNNDHPLMKTSEPTRDDLECWVSDLKLFLKLDWKLEMESLFTPENADRIFTCDEILIAFSKLDDKGEKIPLKSLLKNQNGEEKQLVTVIAAASASGQYLMPHLLTSAENIDTNQFPTLDTSSYKSVHSLTGLITQQIFLDWIMYFDDYLTKNNVKRPVVILLDDHQSHFFISVFLYCLDRRIIPVCLPPKLNKIIQPLLAHFFPKLMMAYQACCKRYSSKTGNAVTPDNFPYIMMKAWTLVTKPKYVIDGFSACKLLPMEVTQLPVRQTEPAAAPLPPPVPAPPVYNAQSSRETVSADRIIKDEPMSNGSEDDGDSSAQQQPEQNNISLKDIGQLSSKAKKIVKKHHKLVKTSSSTPNAPFATSSLPLEVVLGDKFVSDDRKAGRREGIEMCLSVLESFVPADILPVWRQRASSHTGTCEIGYCMWKAVQLLQKGGLDMVGEVRPQTLQYGSGSGVN